MLGGFSLPKYSVAMTVVGLTGGFGAGKSQVSRYFQSFGAMVLDADQLARDALERGSHGFESVVEAFGDQILQNGEINRRALGEIVFRDEGKRKLLESIVHPYVREEFKKAASRLREGEVLVYEIPLLVETQAMENFDLIITVEAPDAMRRERLRAKGYVASEIERRMAAQASSEQRRSVADVVIENSSDLDSLLRACEKIWEERITPLK